MLIIVASNNIFRRELTSYTLLEAGHDIREIFSLGQLQHLVELETPMLIIADASVAEPDALLHILHQTSAPPLLWLGRVEQANGAAAALTSLDWPYRPDELLASVARLSVQHIAATPSPPTLRQRTFGQ